jgi:hypothetical protein
MNDLTFDLHLNEGFHSKIFSPLKLFVCKVVNYHSNDNNEVLKTKV